MVSACSLCQLKIWHNMCRQAWVDAKAICKKLSKQLWIDLEPHEKVHLWSEPVVHSELKDVRKIQRSNSLDPLMEPIKPKLSNWESYLLASRSEEASKYISKWKFSKR
eukprot:scaffold34921_cov162-Amphora_coffeaeformis.AAC.2